MCKTTIIHVDADAFFAQLKARPIKTNELKAKGYTPEKIKEMEEMNILMALQGNQIKKKAKKGKKEDGK
jgi:hypothetical protein